MAATTNVCDGDWHLACFGHDPTSAIAYASLDGATPLAYAVSAAYQPTGMVADNLGAGRQATPAWLEVDPNEKKGTVRGLPIRDDIQIPVQEQMIVELFSK